MTIRRLLAPAAAAAALIICTTSMASAAVPAKLDALHQATAKYRNIATAEVHGYGLLKDAKGVACIAMPGMGTMGVHWAKSDLVGDPAIVPTKPEALVYAPGRDGRLRLAAVEYVVLKDAWDATHTSRPSVFGHRFQLTPSPNRFGLPAFYSRHVWVWQDNPAGTYAPWNPNVHCGNSA